MWQSPPQPLEWAFRAIRGCSGVRHHFPIDLQSKIAAFMTFAGRLRLGVRIIRAGAKHRVLGSLLAQLSHVRWPDAYDFPITLR